MTCARRAWLNRLILRLAVVCAVAITAFDCIAFKMGSEVKPLSEGGGSSRDHFGDPIHEEMTAKSIDFAKRHAEKLCGGTTVGKITAFLVPSARAHLSHEMCCHQGTESRLCDKLGEERTKAFPDVSPPLVTGVRWNDDICHMTRQISSGKGWAPRWMNGLDVGRFNNLNYASHYHELQFLHAMAPTSRTRPFDMLDAKSTIRRIEMWAEFAFRVAEGTIPTNTQLKDVRPLLTKGLEIDFDLAWKAWSRFQVDELFTGVKGAPSEQVRQAALGALLHTVQDSFSTSHVQREKDRRDGFSPLLTGKGNIVRFHSYRLQSPSKHGVADRRPTDIEGALVGDLHPVAIGAELLACASEGAAIGQTKWPVARKVVAITFKLSNPKVNLRANAGDGMGAGSSDFQSP